MRPPGGRRRHVALDIVAAHHVQDDIHALAPGFGLDHRDEIFVPVIDGALCAQAFAGLAFLIAARRGENVMAARRQQLNRIDADAAGAAMHQHAFRPACSRAVSNRVGPDGEKRFRKCRRIHQRQRRGHRQHAGCGGHRIFGIAAAGDQGADRCRRPPIRSPRRPAPPWCRTLPCPGWRRRRAAADNRPCACSMSAWLRPAAATLISTSPGARLGAVSMSCSTSRYSGPGFSMAMARMTNPVILRDIDLNAKEDAMDSDDLQPAQETAGHPAWRRYFRPVRA